MSQQDSLCPKCGLISWSGHRCAAILEGEEHMSRKAMKLALEALEFNQARWQGKDDAITALRQALEQPAQQEVDWEKLYRLEVKKKEALAAKYERDTGKQLTRIVPMNQPTQQEPVAWANSFDLQNFDMKVRTGPDLHHTAPLYTAPQKKEWVGLTDEEIFSILENLQTIYNRPPTEDSRIIFAQAIEAKLKEKNHG